MWCFDTRVITLAYHCKATTWHIVIGVVIPAYGCNATTWHIVIGVIIPADGCNASYRWVQKRIRTEETEKFFVLMGVYPITGVLSDAIELCVF